MFPYLSMQISEQPSKDKDNFNLCTQLNNSCSSLYCSMNLSLKCYLIIIAFLLKLCLNHLSNSSCHTFVECTWKTPSAVAAAFFSKTWHALAKIIQNMPAYCFLKAIQMFVRTLAQDMCSTFEPANSALRDNCGD